MGGIFFSAITPMGSLYKLRTYHVLYRIVWLGVTAMSNGYRIEPAGNAFIVIDPWGERLVDVFPTEEAAKEEIERCRREDALFETACLLVEISEEVLMQKFGIDRKTAQYWVSSATGG
jgi:hypothetical protein